MWLKHDRQHDAENKCCSWHFEEVHQHTALGTHWAQTCCDWVIPSLPSKRAFGWGLPGPWNGITGHRTAQELTEETRGRHQTTARCPTPWNGVSWPRIAGRWVVAQAHHLKESRQQPAATSGPGSLQEQHLMPGTAGARRPPGCASAWRCTGAAPDAGTAGARRPPGCASAWRCTRSSTWCRHSRRPPTAGVCLRLEVRWLHRTLPDTSWVFCHEE